MSGLRGDDRFRQSKEKKQTVRDTDKHVKLLSKKVNANDEAFEPMALAA